MALSREDLIFMVTVLAAMETAMAMATVMAMVMVESMEAVITLKIEKAFSHRSKNYSAGKGIYYIVMPAECNFSLKQ